MNCSIVRFARRGERGMVLVLVLLIILVLTVILLEFSSETNLEVEISAGSYRSAQALNCAEAGISFAVGVLRQNPDALYDDTLKKLLNGETAVPIGEGECKVTVEVESGRLNINALTTADGNVNRARVSQFLRLIDTLNAQEGVETPISYSVAASIIDWIDDDDDTTTLDWVEGENEGAENDYYQGLTPPYLCKNAPFDSVDELLRVRGMTREILDGRKGDAEHGIKPIEGMRKFLTVCSDGKVDINQAPLFVLQSLSPQITEAMAQAIVDRRNTAPFKYIEELRLAAGLPPNAYNAIKNFITVSPQDRYFSIISVGAVAIENQAPIERRVREVVKLHGAHGDATVLLRQEP